MADLRAEQIMVAIKALLDTPGLTTTGTRVYRARVWPVQSDEYPGLLLYQGADQPEDIGEHTYDYQRSQLLVRVVGVVKATASLDTTLNLIRKEVVAAVLADITLGLGFVSRAMWAGAEEPVLDEGDKPVAWMVMNFVVEYSHSWADHSA